MQINMNQSDNAVLFEYTSAASPDCEKIKPDIFDFSMMELKVNQVNDIYQSPNIKVKFLKVINNSICVNSNASSHVFYVLNGTGSVHFNDQFIKWNQGDVFTIPFCQDIIFKSKYAAILNISPDHLERHGTINNYILAKFKLIKNQNKNSIVLINKFDKYIQNRIKKIKYKSKIFKSD